MSTEQAPDRGIDYFNRGHWLTHIQERMSKRVRRRMFELWIAHSRLSRGSRVLDVGATPDVEREDSNCMITWLLEIGADVTLYSPEDIDELARVFEGVHLLPKVEVKSGIPAEPKQYEWACSSAVLEHVGSRERQVEFVRECGRVAKDIFLTTPNRRHWLEFHTKLPFLHWLPRTLHRKILRAIGLKYWASEERLRLVGRVELLGIAREALGEDFNIEVKSVRALGMVSNLILLANGKE